MRLRDIIRAEKTDIQISDWTRGRISRAAFPLSKAKGKHYKQGSAYEWAVIRFAALGGTFRILLRLNESKAIFSATLGMDDGGDTKTLCVHEFHASEPGWHCHVDLRDVSEVAPGLHRANMRRWPRGSAPHSRLVFGVTKANAIGAALRFYRVEERGPLL